VHAYCGATIWNCWWNLTTQVVSSLPSGVHNQLDYTRSKAISCHYGDVGRVTFITKLCHWALFWAIWICFTSTQFNILKSISIFHPHLYLTEICHVLCSHKVFQCLCSSYHVSRSPSVECYHYLYFIFLIHFYLMSRDSLVGIATGYGLDDQGEREFESR
jgi:hypothetical protein